MWPSLSSVVTGKLSSVASLWPSSSAAHPVTGGAAETDVAWVGAVYIAYLHLKMETLWSGGSQLSAPVNCQQYETTIVFEPQAGVSLIGDRVDADFRPEGMVVLLAISCSPINRRAVLIALVAVRHLFSGFLWESGNISVITEFGTFFIGTCNI